MFLCLAGRVGSTAQHLKSTAAGAVCYRAGGGRGSLGQRLAFALGRFGSPWAAAKAVVSLAGGVNPALNNAAELTRGGVSCPDFGMALDKPDVVDAVGIENNTGFVVLTIADPWDWNDERRHLLALQAKLNAYFSFIESGQIWLAYPDAVGRKVIIDVVGRFTIPQIGMDLLKRASGARSDLGVEIRSRHFPGSPG